MLIHLQYIFKTGGLCQFCNELNKCSACKRHKLEDDEHNNDFQESNQVSTFNEKFRITEKQPAEMH
jgi:hypothetical protein